MRPLSSACGVNPAPATCVPMLMGTFAWNSPAEFMGSLMISVVKPRRQVEHEISRPELSKPSRKLEIWWTIFQWPTRVGWGNSGQDSQLLEASPQKWSVRTGTGPKWQVFCDFRDIETCFSFPAPLLSLQDIHKRMESKQPPETALGGSDKGF